MSGPAWFPWVIAALFAYSIALQIRGGFIRTYMGPKVWRCASKADDPGRFWLMIVAETIVMIGAICVGLFQ